MAKKVSAVEKNTNYATITPDEFISMMTSLYSSPIGLAQPAKMLWGQPGIGKSQAVQQFGEALSKATNKKVNVHIVSLLLMSPIDLRGIPAKATNDEGKEIARWLPPEIFNMDSSDNVINILFLDEISAAPLSVQAAAYQICLDKRIGEHQLPKNTLVICAGNRVTDKAVAFKMPKPLANRLTHFEMTTSYNSWKKWAIANNIDARIMEYIRYTNGEALNRFDPKTDDVAFPTPRSWEMVDTYLKTIDSKLSLKEQEEKFDNIFPAIEGCIGAGTAIEFKNHISTFGSLPDIEAIKNGKLKKLDSALVDKPDIMYFLSAVLVSILVKAGQEVDLSKETARKDFDNLVTNVFGFILNWPQQLSEFQVYILKDFNSTLDTFAQSASLAVYDNDNFTELIQKTALNMRI